MTLIEWRPHIEATPDDRNALDASSRARLDERLQRPLAIPRTHGVAEACERPIIHQEGSAMTSRHLLVICTVLMTAACAGNTTAPTAPTYTPPPRVVQTLIGLAFSPDTSKIPRGYSLPAGAALDISSAIVGKTDVGPALKGNRPISDLCPDFTIGIVSGPGALWHVVTGEGTHLYGLQNFPTTVSGTTTVIVISACGFHATQVYLVM
jgi:hypothetical protein